MALVIGNSSYDTSPLKNPANDATDMADLLKSAGFEVILKTDADKRAMLESIEAFGRKLPRAEIGMLYFAGHGMQIKGRNYLIPVNARVASETDVELESVDVYRVLGRMEAAANPVNIIILDACRDNPFERSFRNAEKGLAKIDAPAGSIIVFSTSPGGVAADGQGRNGIFTSHLLKTLSKPGISLTRALMETRRNVAAETSRQQIPWESSSLMQDVYLLAGGAPEDRDLMPVQPQPVTPAQSHAKTASRIEPSTIPLAAAMSDDKNPPSSPRAGDIWKEPMTGMEFVWVPGGCYDMGCGDWQDIDICYSREFPVHEVCL
ncbi:MAG: caspase family protein, partial [Longimonas sp.]